MDLKKRRRSLTLIFPGCTQPRILPDRAKALSIFRNLLLLAIAGLLLWSFRVSTYALPFRNFPEIRWGWLLLSVAASLIALPSVVLNAGGC